MLMTGTLLLRYIRKVFRNGKGIPISIGITNIVVVIVGDAIGVCGASVGGCLWEI